MLKGDNVWARSGGEDGGCCTLFEAEDRSPRKRKRKKEKERECVDVFVRREGLRQRERVRKG